jgi:pseudouridine-5'-phosphate glycosidase/pseudouridine kinase
MSSLPGLKSLLRVSDEVAHAIATNKPVVALESTIYTHGGLGELHLEEIVRDNGGVPAICGIYKGVPTVGLTWDREIQEMIREGAQKVSRRDFAMLVGMVGVIAALTCS